MSLLPTPPPRSWTQHIALIKHCLVKEPSCVGVNVSVDIDVYKCFWPKQLVFFFFWLSGSRETSGFPLHLLARWRNFRFSSACPDSCYLTTAQPFTHCGMSQWAEINTVWDFEADIWSVMKPYCFVMIALQYPQHMNLTLCHEFYRWTCFCSSNIFCQPPAAADTCVHIHVHVIDKCSSLQL